MDNSKTEIKFGYGKAETIASSHPKHKRCAYCHSLHEERGLFCSKRCQKLDDNEGPRS